MEYDDGIRYFKCEDGQYAFYDELTDATHSCELSGIENVHIMYGKIIDEWCLQILDIVPKDQREEAEKRLNAIYNLNKKMYGLEMLIQEKYHESSDQEVAEDDNYLDEKDTTYLDDGDLLRELDNI